MRILLVAYYFPPIPGGGSQRPQWLARGLAAHGHEVTVLAAGYRGDQRGDGVVRVHDPSHNRHRRGRFALQWLVQRLAVEAANRAGGAASIYGRWRRRATAAALDLHRRHPFDLVLASYPPVETLEIGLALRAAGGPPLVADFRDGLCFEPIEAPRLRRHAVLRRHYEALEDAVRRRAALILAAHPGHAEHLRRGAAADVVVLPNGWDPADFADLEPAELPAPERHLVHAGGFAASDADCDVTPLLTALAAVGDEPGGGPLVLDQLGRLTRAERRAARALLAAGRLVDHGPVARRRCLAFERAADALLLVASPRRPSVVPGKLFEYLAAGPPVVGVAPPAGYAAQLLRETGCGVVVDPADGAGLRAVLRAVRDGRHLPDAPARNPAAVAGHTVGARLEVLDAALRSAVATLPAAG